MNEEKVTCRWFNCANGRKYLMPENHCVFCERCTDLFYDYTNGPYMFMCNLDTENESHEWQTCGKFMVEDAEDKE